MMKATLVLGLLGSLVGSGAAFSACKPCLALVGFIESELTRDQSQEDAVLDAACAKEIPGPFVKVCDAIVNQGIKLVVGEIDTKQPPPVVCHECHLCKASELATFQLEKALNNGNPVEQICAVLHQAESDLKDGKLDAVCQELQSSIHFPVSICNKLKAQEGRLELLLEKALALCPASEPQAAVLAKGNPFGQLCAAVELVEEELKNGAVDKACAFVAQYDPKLNCQEIKAQMEPKIEAFLAIAEKLCQSSEEELAAIAASVTPCQVAQEALKEARAAVAELPEKAQAFVNKYVIPKLVKAVAVVCQH